MTTGGKWGGPSLSSLGQRIKMVREWTGLSQVAFAHQLRVSRSYVSEVEAEKAKPSIEIVAGIAREFPEIDPGWLLTGKGEMYTAEHRRWMSAPDRSARKTRKG